MAEIISRYSCYVLSDEVYEHIIFDGNNHASVLSHEQLCQRSFAVFSFGKTYHVTGWKVGYAVAPADLTAELRKIHQFNVFTTPTPMQWALADFIIECPRSYQKIKDFYQKKRDLFVSLMKTSAFRLFPSRSTYFQLADYSAISNQGDTEFANWMTIEKGVASIPLSPFYQTSPNSNIIRFCFAKQDETLVQAAEILCDI